MSDERVSRFAPTSEFWRDKRVLLTGHTGFKGSWLVLWLNALGAKVRGFSLEPDTEPSLFRRLNLETVCDHRIGDIRDVAAVRSAFAEFDPEIVLHMAAQPLVRRSYRDPLDTLSTNVLGTANVLDACRDLPSLKAIVSVTTDKCYLNNEWAYSYRENDPLGGADPYSASKACAEIVSSSWRASFFSKETNGRPAVALATARAGNVFGGGDWSEDRLIPDCSRAFLSNAPVQLRFPAAVRPWQFVLEPLAGYLMLAQALVEEGAPYAKAWNFGPRNEQLLTVGEVVDGFAAAWGQGASAEHQAQADAPHEAGLLLLDSGLANRELGWRPRLEVDEALEATARWYRAAHAGEDLIALSLEQIARFGTRSGGA